MAASSSLVGQRSGGSAADAIHGGAMNDRRVVPLVFRVYDAVPLAPVWVGLGLLLLLLAGSAVLLALLGLPLGQHLLSDLDLVQFAMLAYGPTAAVISLRAAQRNLRALAPTLDCSAELLEAEVERLASVPLRWFRLSRLTCLALGVGFVFLTGSWDKGRPPLGDPLLTWVALLSGLLGWVLGATIHLEIAHGLQFGRIGASLARVELLDESALHAFGRQGLRGVAVLLGVSMLFSILFFAPYGRASGTFFSLAFAAMAGLTLWLPARGVHARIVTARDDELARVNAGIVRAREANLAATGTVDARLSNLLAYRALLAGVRTWPFDLSTWVRFAVYVMLGLGSWLGGALVERLLGRALDS